MAAARDEPVCTFADLESTKATMHKEKKEAGKPKHFWPGGFRNSMVAEYDENALFFHLTSSNYHNYRLMPFKFHINFGGGDLAKGWNIFMSVLLKHPAIFLKCKLADTVAMTTSLQQWIDEYDRRMKELEENPKITDPEEFKFIIEHMKRAQSSYREEMQRYTQLAPITFYAFHDPLYGRVNVDELNKFLKELDTEFARHFPVGDIPETDLRVNRFVSIRVDRDEMAQYLDWNESLLSEHWQKQKLAPNVGDFVVSREELEKPKPPFRGDSLSQCWKFYSG